jgi:hypothetical protein
MSKSRKTSGRKIYDEIRKPTPKTGFAFKSKKRQLEEDELDSEIENWDVDYKLIRKMTKND